METFAGMREAERYQLKVAEKFYLQGEYEVARDEYDKFLTLYQRSDGAPYALMMWAHCQRRLRHVNTAIRDGFQSVIDYWPDSREARMAAFLIAESYVAMGETGPAAEAFRQLIEMYPDHHLALRSKLGLLDLAEVARDQDEIEHWLEQLTFHTKRTEAAESACVSASRKLATRRFARGEVVGAREALATSYSGYDEVFQLEGLGRGIIQGQYRHDDDEARERAVALADQLLELLEQCLPEDLEKEGAASFTRELLVRMAGIHGAVGRSDQIRETWLRMGRLLGKDDGVRARLAAWHKANGERDVARRIYAEYDHAINGRKEIVAMDREDGRWDDAIAGYGELIRIDEDGTVEYMVGIAGCHLAAGRVDETIETYRELIRIDEDGTVEYMVAIARCYLAAGRVDETIETYRELIQIDPDSAGSYHWTIGEICEGAGRLEQAIREFSRSGRFPQNYFRMASCHRKLEQWEKALELYQQVKAAGESMPEADLQIAFTLEQADQRKQALRAFQRTCHSHPRSGQASRAHAHVQEHYGISITLGGATDE